jgi:hypothetical protein
MIWRSAPTVLEDSMRVVRSFQSKLDADLAKIALEAAGVPSLVVGTGVEFEGGANGVQLLVPDEWVAAANAALERPGSPGVESV